MTPAEESQLRAQLASERERCDEAFDRAEMWRERFEAQALECARLRGVEIELRRQIRETWGEVQEQAGKLAAMILEARRENG